MNAPNVWAVVPAAGIGRRFGGDRPKQYAALGGRPVIAHVIAKLASVRGVAGIVAAVAPVDPWWNEAAASFDVPVATVDGGAERRDSVLNALDHLSTIAAGHDLVMVHDAVRPCVTVADVERVAAAARRHPHGAILAAPVCDTLKRAGPRESIVDTVDRHQLWRAFTPQVFPLGRLRTALRDAVESGGTVTDEAQAMERTGARPLLVEGSPGNIKITRREDLALARAWLEAEEGAAVIRTGPGCDARRAASDAGRETRPPASRPGHDA